MTPDPRLRARRIWARIALSLPLAVLGYLFFAIVVAIYTGIWLQGDKMYYAQGLSAHLFGAVGAALGTLLAWMIWRLSRSRS